METNLLVISVTHRVHTNPEVKMAMSKGGGLDPWGCADPISPNLLVSFAARCLLHNLIYIIFGCDSIINQRQKESIIKENLNIWKKKFFNTYMIPIIQDFMKFYEASIVIDIDSKAFRLVIFDSRINITDSVIERMNNLYINIDEITQEIIS